MNWLKSIPFKGKLFALGAAFLAILGFIAGILANNSRVSEYRKKIETKEVILHKKAANEAFKKAKTHIEKSKKLSAKIERESSESEDEAIMKWNDDKI